MGDLVKLRGDHSHPEVLSGGQTVAPGEPFSADLLDPEDAGDSRLLDDGLIIGAVVAPAALEGEALQSRAKELGVKRSGLTADELRDAVALAEAQQQTAAVPVDDVQPMKGA